MEAAPPIARGLSSSANKITATIARVLSSSANNKIVPALISHPPSYYASLFAEDLESLKRAASGFSTTQHQHSLDELACLDRGKAAFSLFRHNSSTGSSRSSSFLTSMKASLLNRPSSAPTRYKTGTKLLTADVLDAGHSVFTSVTATIRAPAALALAYALNIAANNFRLKALEDPDIISEQALDRVDHNHHYVFVGGTRPSR